MKRLVLIDGNALLHRAFHATPMFTTSKGEIINAVYGFSSMLFKVLEDLKPDYLAVAWDMRSPTFRHNQFESYKANRGPADDNLTSQYERVHQVVSAFNIPEFKLPGFEADDLVGTLARLTERQQKSTEVIIVTGDRDIMQLIDHRVKVFMPKKTIQDVGLYGEEEFIARFGFEPKYLVDFKGLAGDASDNIPGVSGIGEVTATKLIQKYKTLENVYKNLNDLPERIKKLLIEGEENARLSKKLATIETELPVKFDLQKSIVSNFNRDDLINIFTQLEFKSLLSRIPNGDKEHRSEDDTFENMNNKLPGEDNLKESGEDRYSISNDSSFTTELDHQVEPLLQQMSENGVLIDLKFLDKLRIDMKGRLVDLEREIYSIIGHEINIKSPKQLQQLLFDQLNLPVIKKIKTGRSTDEETLIQLINFHPAVKLILEYRQLFKLISTYLDALPKYADINGRVHSTFNVEGAATGRLSSQNPNLQNIPIRGTEGGEIRKSFIAEPGKILLGADYSQIELRIMAHLTDDPGLRKSFEEGLDIHAATAARIFNIPIGKVTKEQRMVGKTTNFATLYGQGAHSLSRQLGVDYKTAQGYISEYFMQFPKVHDWMNKIIQEGREKGFVETVWGRKRYIPELGSSNHALSSFGERAAVNHPVQGCLPEDTRILTSSGYIPIGTLYKSDPKPPFVWDGTEWRPYTVLNRGTAQLARIKFSNGQIFKCDTRHKVLTVGEQGYEWMEFIKLRPGVKVCFSVPMIFEFYPKSAKYDQEEKRKSDLFLEFIMKKDLWYWLGYYIGNGYLSKKKSKDEIYSLTYLFSKDETQKRKECIRFFALLDPNLKEQRNKGKSSTSYSVVIQSQILGDIFKHLEVGDTKTIPSLIFTESIEKRFYFIKGILDSSEGEDDQGGNLTVCLDSRELLQDLQLLLRTLGVGSLIKGPYFYKNNSFYRLDIVKSLITTVELPKYNQNLRNLYPLPTVRNDFYVEKQSYKVQFVPNAYYPLKDYGGCSPLIYPQSGMEGGFFRIETPVYQYNEILEIEELDRFETTYTLSVPGSHRFDSEGVISKNTAADMIKKAMLQIDQKFKEKNVGCKMILQIHDELLFECNPHDLSQSAAIVKENMENALKLSVPVKVEVKVGHNWGQMESFEVSD